MDFFFLNVLHTLHGQRKQRTIIHVSKSGQMPVQVMVIFLNGSSTLYSKVYTVQRLILLT